MASKLSGLGQYTKFIVAVAGQGLTFASLYYGTNHWVVLAVAIASALGVYISPNTKPVVPPVVPPAPVAYEPPLPHV